MMLSLRHLAVVALCTLMINCTIAGGHGKHEHKAKDKNIVTIASNAGQFELLIAAAKAAGLADTLAGKGNFTVFAPTDEAFKKLPPETLNALLQPENKEALKAILLYHVLASQTPASDVVRVDQLKTLNGQFIKVNTTGDNVKLNASGLVKTDIKASNGIIHVIDTVLLPEDMPTIVTKNPAIEIIELAIDRGVPLFNNGQTAACAAIYEVAATALVNLDKKYVSDNAREKLVKALKQVKASSDSSGNAWTLRYALNTAMSEVTKKQETKQASAAPAPAPTKKANYVKEAKLPEGFPEPSPVGQITLKKYPAYRAAVVEENANWAFMKLFSHIKKNKIAMTAPVTMGLDENGTSETSMAFLYGKPNMGKTGNAGDGVVVKDIPEQEVLSIGMQGSKNRSLLKSNLKKLNDWVAKNDAYEVDGKPRLLGYNSPWVPNSKKYWEIQLPVKRVNFTMK